MKAKFLASTTEFDDEVTQLILKRLNIVAPGETWFESDLGQFGSMKETVAFVEDSIDLAIKEMLELKKHINKGK